MIDDYIDGELRIPLGKMSDTAALERLVLAYNIDEELARSHVERCVNRNKLAGLKPQQAITVFRQNGWAGFSNDYLYSSQYDKLVISCEEKSYHCPIAQFVFVTDMISLKAELRLYAKHFNALTLHTLDALLFTEKSALEPGYDHLALVFNEPDDRLLLDTINQLFDRLEKNFSINFNHERLQAIQCAQKYISDHHADFPGGNYYLRTRDSMPQAQLNRVRPNAIIQALQKAINTRNYKLVKHYLEQGVNPNEEFYGCPLTNYIFPYSTEENAEYTYKTLSIFNLLFEYGAQVHHPTRPLLSRLLYQAIIADIESNQYYILEQMIRLVIRLDNGVCYSHLHRNNHPLFKLVKDGQSNLPSNLKRANLFTSNTVLKIKIFEKIFSFATQRFYHYNNESIRITTMTIREIKQNNLLSLLYNNFKNSPPWKGRLTEKELIQSFSEIINTEGIALVDLVWHDHQLVGYQISDIIANADGTVTHYIKLALIKATVKAPGLMFALQERGFEIGKSFETITAFESASAASYLQLIGMNFYPHVKQDFERWMNLLKKTIYAKVTHKIKYDSKTNIYYFEDPLATFELKPSQEQFYTRTLAASTRFFGPDKTYIPKNSYLVFYKNDAENYTLYLNKLEQNIDTSSSNNAMAAKL